MVTHTNVLAMDNMVVVVIVATPFPTTLES